MNKLKYLKWLPHIVFTVVALLCLADAIHRGHFPQFIDFTKFAASVIGCVGFVVATLSLPKLFLGSDTHWRGWLPDEKEHNEPNAGSRLGKQYDAGATPSGVQRLEGMPKGITLTAHRPPARITN